MPKRVPEGLIHQIRTLARPTGSDVRADADLLAAFVRDGDQAAFAALVVRHRRVVWDTCRSILSNDADAEDAFQAVFIALARSAARVYPSTLEAWLRTVAHRATVNTMVAARRRDAAHRRLYERAVESHEEPVLPEEDLRAAVREELAELPERLRVPLTLYYLEGKTQAEVGRILGVTDRAAAARLTHGLASLRKRLSVRGLTVPSAALIAALGGMPISAAVPAGLVAVATKAALASATGVGPATTSGRLALEAVRLGFPGRVKLYGIILAFTGLGMTGGAALLSGEGPAQATGAGAPNEATNPPRVDRFGDLLPAGAVARVGTGRFRVGRATGSEDVTFMTGGRLLASVHGGPEIAIWDAATGKAVRTLAGPEGASWVAATPDGRLLAVAGATEVWAFDLRPATPNVSWKWTTSAGTHRPAITGLSFSPDGRIVAVGDHEGRCTRLLAADTGAERSAVPGRAMAVTAARDGAYVAAIGGHDPSAWADRLVVWDTTVGRPVRTLDAPVGKLFVDAALSDDGRVAVREVDGIVRVIDVKTGEEPGQWAASRPRARRNLAFLPGGKEIIEIDQSRITFRDTATGRETRTPVSAPALSLQCMNHNLDVSKQLSPDGRTLATVTGGEVSLWDVATGQPRGPVGQVQGGLEAVSYSSDGRSLLTYANRAGEVQVWDAASGEPGAVLASTDGDETVGLGWGADGRPIVRRRAAAIGGPGQLIRADLRTGAESDRIPLPGVLGPISMTFGRLTGMSATPNGDRLAIGGGNAAVVFNRDGGEVARLESSEGVARVGLSADGRTLVSVTQKWLPRVPGGGPRPPVMGVELWDVETRKPRPIPGDDSAQWDLHRAPPALSPDGRWIAAITWGRAITMYEIASGRSGQRFKSSSQLQSVAFSPNGRYLAAGGADGAVTVWDLATGERSRLFSGHRGPVQAVTFSPVARRLASCSLDGTALVWDLAEADRPAGKMRPAEELCAALAGEDVAVAHRAACALADQPDAAIRLLSGRLAPPLAPPVATVRRWVTDLGDDRYAVRERAEAALMKAGEGVVPALDAALAAGPGAEARARIEQLIARWQSDASPERIARVRAIGVLERIGTPAARKALEDAAGRCEAGASSDLEAALRRLREPGQQ